MDIAPSMPGVNPVTKLYLYPVERLKSRKNKVENRNQSSVYHSKNTGDVFVIFYMHRCVHEVKFS